MKVDKKRVLIVEDDDDVRQGMHILLSRRYEVRSVQDGTSAMVAARQQTPDAIVLDLGLPGGDSLRILDWMRDLRQLIDIPKIVVTGRDLGAAERQALDCGATHVFAKPADADELIQTIESATADAAERPRTVSVLLVEDDVDVRLAIGLQLKRAGYHVHGAADGATALLQVTRERPDVILLDLGLPGGGGRALLERIRANPETARIPVVVVTGRDLEHEGRELYAAGADALLQKPPTLDLLMEAIEGVR